MASTFTMLLVLLFQLISTAKSDIEIPPSLAPFFDDLCDEIDCGRGNCSVDVAKPFSFVCRCDPGWRRTLSDNQDHLQFLPCIIPNCSLDYSCITTPPPTPPITDDISFFDPCYWSYCGEGKCENRTAYKHICDCNPGCTNLMNISHFPCFRSCAIGTDCSGLGGRSSATKSPPDDSSQGIRFISGDFHCIGVIMISLALALWKHFS